MKKNICVLSIVLGLVFSVSAQQVNTLYFLENSPYRHTLNPALQPVSRIYVGIAPIAYTSLSLGNNSLTLRDVIYQNPTNPNSTITAIHPDGDVQKLLKSIRPALSVNADINLNLLSFGFRLKEKGYVHILVNERIESSFSLPKALLNIPFGGVDPNGSSFNLKHIGMSMVAYTEIGGGYSRILNDKWTVGGKFKLLLGSAYVGIKAKKLNLDASCNQWALDGNGSAYIAGPIASYPEALNSQAIDDYMQLSTNEILGLPNNPSVSDYLKLAKPAGLGIALDLGATYRPINQVQISFSVTDFGFITWGNGMRYNVGVHGVYDGCGDLNYGDFKDKDGKFDGSILGDTIKARLSQIYKNMATSETGKKSFTRMLTCRFNVGVDANFWENKVGVGVMTQTRILPNGVDGEVTIGASFRPVNWFNIAASYSLVNNGRYSCLGAALGLMPYDGLHLTLAMDYIPTSFASISDNGGYFIPYKTIGVNLAMGICIVVGTNKSKKEKNTQQAMISVD